MLLYWQNADAVTPAKMDFPQCNYLRMRSHFLQDFKY